MAARSARTVLVGREDALAVLLESAHETRDSGLVVLINGEAGIGKTTLIEHFSLEMSNVPMQVLAGGCVQLAGDPIPYAPLAEALRRFRRIIDDKSERGIQARSEMDHLFGVQLKEQAHSRGELYERVLRLLELLSEGTNGCILVLEDLHWADQATLDLVTFLARNLPDGLLLILSYRSDELSSRPPLEALLAVIARERYVRRVDLLPFTKDELATLAKSTRGHPLSAAELDGLLTRSEGNPLIAGELLLNGDPAGETSSLDEVLLVRAGGLSRKAEEVMRLAAVIGRTVSHDDLIAAAIIDEESLSAALRETVRCGLLTVDGQREEYAFRHVLTQEAVLRRLMPGERRLMHATVAAAFQSRSETSRSASRAAECATHWYLSGNRSAALASAVSAGRLAATVYAYTDAWRQFQRALELFDKVEETQAETEVQRLEVMLDAAEAARWSGATDIALALAQETLSLTANAVEQGRISERVGQYLWDAGRQRDAQEAFEQAHQHLIGSPLTPLVAMVAASRAHLLVLSGRHDAAIPAARDAIETAIAVRAPAVEGRARITLGLCLTFGGSLTEGIALVLQGHKQVGSWGNLDDRRRADSNLSYALLMAGQTAEACSAAMAGLAMIRRYGLDAATGFALTANAIVLLRYAGRWDEAEQLIEEVVPEELPAGHAPYFHLSCAELQIARGNLDHARTHLDRTWSSLGDASAGMLSSDIQLAESELALERRELEEAKNRIRHAIHQIPDGAPARLILLVHRMALRIEGDIAEHAQWTGQIPSADLLIERELLITRVQQARLTSPSPEVEAIAATAEAEESRSRLTSDPERWQRAAEAWEQISRPRERAYCCYRYAEAELDVRRSSTDAVDSLRRSHTIATSLGATSIRRDAEDLARRSRIDLVPQRAEPTSQPPAAKVGLTPRELEVLRALVLGHTNRDIGKQLFLSHRTVAVHVSSVLSKLGVSNRGQAAAAATRLRLLDEVVNDDR